jgi:hypothetical protein
MLMSWLLAILTLNDVVVGDADNVDAYFGRIIGTTTSTPSPPQPQPPVTAPPPQPQPTVAAPSLPQPQPTDVAAPPPPSRAVIAYDPSNSVMVSTEGTRSGLLMDGIDADGFNDIIVGHHTATSVGDSDIVIYQGEASGTLSSPGSAYQGKDGRCADCCSDFRTIVSGDLNGDGHKDLIAAAEYLPCDRPTFFILLNDGGMRFLHSTQTQQQFKQVPFL